MTFLNILGIRKVFTQIILLYEMQRATPLLNIGGIVDLPLLETLLAIRQKSGEPNFWEVMHSFVL